MESAYDLHIHSCLSPCASDDMTPANIAGMAHIKGLSVISLTDHNTGKNLIPMAKAAKEYDLLFVPGIEVTSLEEVHVLVYFAELSRAVDFGDSIYDSLPDIDNRPDIFGNQIVMNHNDQPAGELKKLLLQASPYSIDALVSMATNNGGTAVPAHINRDSFSLLSNIGYIPPNLFRCAEVCKTLPCPAIDPHLLVLHSSDAHRLGDISEPQNTLSNIKTVKQFLSQISIQS